MIDYLIVGAGLYGATCARLLTDKGYSCLVIDKRNHIAGNIYSTQINGIDIHKYGPHIFHTNNVEIWDFVNKYCTIRQFQLNVIANYKGMLFHLPFSLTTMYELFKMYDVEAIKNVIKNEINSYLKTTEGNCDLWNTNGAPASLESQAIGMVGVTVFETLIKGYTEKQWGKTCRELSPSIINRLPVRYHFDNNYFNDAYQGIPKQGYTSLVSNILENVPILLNTNFLDNIDYWVSQSKNIIYCGAPDELLNYVFGPLEWRSLRFDEQEIDKNNFQGTAIMNFTDRNIPYTRIIEHKWFTPWRFNGTYNTNNTIITYEYPETWEIGKEKYYSINNSKTDDLYNKYVDAIKIKFPNIILGGRLGLYKYLDMDDTIELAMDFVKSI